MTSSSTESSANHRFHRLKDYFLNLDENDLPGHWDLEIGDGIRHHHQEPAEDAIPAAVTLLVHTTSRDPSLVFIERSHHIGPVQHRGQIAFPGGKKENNETAKECAFRETYEEIGIRLAPQEPTRFLTPLFIPVSKFIIYPCVVFLDEIPAFDPNPAEVKSIIDSPLTEIDERYKIHKTDIQVRDQVLKNVSYYPLDGKILWGASALIFSEFLYLVRQFQEKY